jgi:hypothetical protein
MFLQPRETLEIGEVGSGDLMKALEAGYGADSANMSGGRSLIPQDIQNTLVNALTFKEVDFKLMNMLPKPKVFSTVHEYTRETAVGAEQNIFVAEGGSIEENTSVLERVTKPVKYMQSFRKVTLQMRQARAIEDAEALEKMSGTLEILKGAEAANFHGNSDVIPYEYDGVIKQLGDASSKNVRDMRGANMDSTDGENAFNNLAQDIFNSGGYATHSFMPTIIASDLQKLIRDRLRFNTGDNKGSVVVEKYPTPFSDEIIVAGRNAGPDKFFRIKGAVATAGSTDKPNAPTISLLAQTKTGGTGFTADTEGTYYYTVHAISKDGISVASSDSSQAVSTGQEVEITITPDGTAPGTGFIVCRSKKDASGGTDTREMMRVAKDSGDTVVLDQDDLLPGTGEIVLLSNDGLEPTVQWDQFLPLMKFDLYPTNAAVIPFLVLLFGALDVKVPWYHGYIKNIGYTGLDWY